MHLLHHVAAGPSDIFRFSKIEGGQNQKCTYCLGVVWFCRNLFASVISVQVQENSTLVLKFSLETAFSGQDIYP
jgi:hypothetical protein